MDAISILAFGLLALVTVVLSAALTRLRSQGRDVARLTGALAEAMRDLEAARAEATGRLQDKTEAEARLEANAALLAEARRSQAAAEAAYAEAQAARAEAERDAALARQQVDSTKAQMRDWQATKAESMEAAKAAALKTVTVMSSKLLEDHKRESDRAKQAAEARVKETTEALAKRFEDIAKAVASLNDQVTQNRDVVETVWRALSSPGGAGYFAEIGLENTLKSFGLEPGRDFVMQYNLARGDGGRLRPDAVVFLPGQSVLVIDSKASKFLLELAEAEDEAAHAAATANLAASMNQHLKALMAKDYRTAILDAHRQAGMGDAISRVISVMYLPNEGALEKLTSADSNFPKRAARAEIIPAGPAGLACLIGFARVEIDLGRQAANRERIAEATEGLLGAIAVALGHMDDVGRGIKRSAEGFARLASSVNRNMLPKARTIARLGVRPARSKSLPANMPAYRMVRVDTSPLIEGEAAEVAEAGELPMPEVEADA